MKANTLTNRIRAGSEAAPRVIEAIAQLEQQRDEALRALSGLLNVINQDKDGGWFIGGQIGDLVLQWLRANPAERHRPGGVIVSHVLQQTWPCRQAPARKPGTNL